MLTLAPLLFALSTTQPALARPAEPPLAIPERHQPRPNQRPQTRPPQHAAPPSYPPAPARASKQGTFAVGFRMGSLVGGYRAPGTSYGDFGLGINARYRPVEPLAIEVAFAHHDQAWRRGSLRAQTMGQASVMGFLLPNFVVSPYLLGGLTVTGNHIEDTVYVGQDARTAQRAVHWGPHGGVGVELALGDSWAIDADIRTVGYVNLAQDDATFPVQLQANVGVLMHF